MRRLAVVLALVLTAVACGGGGGTVTPATGITTAPADTAGPVDTNDTNAPAGTTPAKETIGQVTGIVPVGGRVGGADAFEGQGVGRQDLISTEPNGKVIFALGKLLPFCQVETDSEVQVEPGDGSLVDVKRGTALCRTSTDGQLKQFVAGGVVVTAADPVFLLGWDGETATIQVAQGFVRVEGDGGSAVVGANQQAQSGSSGIGVGPWEPQSIQDDQTRKAALAQRDEASSQQPGVRYPSLDPSNSPTLRQAQDRGALVIGVAERGIQTFVQDLFGNMGQLWDVTASVQSEGPVTVSSTPPRGSNAVPIGGVDGTVYFVTTADDDPAFLQAVARFLGASLQAACPLEGGGRSDPGDSCYEEAYRVQLGQDLVWLDPMARYLGLG